GRGRACAAALDDACERQREVLEEEQLPDAQVEARVRVVVVEIGLPAPVPQQRQGAEVRRAQDDRLDAVEHERPGDGHREVGGGEYAAPTSRPVSTPANSIGPCVRASTTGTRPATATIARPWPRVSSPAASGRNGLLTRSISTSSSWLSPTMKTLTVSAATSV